MRCSYTGRVTAPTKYITLATRPDLISAQIAMIELGKVLEQPSEPQRERLSRPLRQVFACKSLSAIVHGQI